MVENGTFETLLWRVAAIGGCILWGLICVFTFFYYLYPQIFPNLKQHIIVSIQVYVILSVITELCLVYLIIYPRRFLVHAGIFWFWALEHLVDGGDVCGLIMYLLGCAFAYRQGFFKAHTRFKTGGVIILVLAALGSQFRYGPDLLLRTFLRGVFLVLAGGLGILLFHPWLRELLAKPPNAQGAKDGMAIPARELNAEDRPPGSSALLKKLSRRQLIILRDIMNRKKYTLIAGELGMSVSGLKAEVKVLFAVLNIPKQSFLLERFCVEDIVNTLETMDEV